MLFLKKNNKVFIHTRERLALPPSPLCVLDQVLAIYQVRYDASSQQCRADLVDITVMQFPKTISSNAEIESIKQYRGLLA